MKEFEFASAGIMLVFAGDDLFLSREVLREIEDFYVGPVSERTVRNVLVSARNTEAIRHQAAEAGGVATFGTVTSWLSTKALGQEGNRWNWIRGMCLYRRRLVKLTGAKMAWVNEFGRRTGAAALAFRERSRGVENSGGGAPSRRKPPGASARCSDKIRRC